MWSGPRSRSRHLASIALLPLSHLIPLTTATCYYRSGAVAATYVQCPGVNFCCTETQYCESNGLCRDKNNHANGSVTYFPGDANPGPYNYTGLYQTPACSNPAFRGCDEECTASNATSFAYVWACTNNLANYCCHNNAVNLDQRDCCADATRFQLASPVALIPSSTSSGATSTTRTRTSTNTATSGANQTASSSGSGLSEGAKIGIGVAVPVAVLLILAVVVLFLRQNKINKRLQHREGEQHPMVAEKYQHAPHEQGDGSNYNHGRAELENNQIRRELEARSKPSETPIDARHELG